jgi:hypothetical protein
MFICRQPTLSIEEKIDMLVEYEMDMRDEGLNTEKAHIAKSKSKVSKHRHHSSNSDSDEGNLINCHLCDGDHAFRFCSHVKLAGKLLKRHFCQQKKLEQSKKKSSQSGGKKPSRKSHGYKATAFTSDDESELFQIAPPLMKMMKPLRSVTSPGTTSVRSPLSLGQQTLAPPLTCLTNLLSLDK